MFVKNVGDLHYSPYMHIVFTYKHNCEFDNESYGLWMNLHTYVCVVFMLANLYDRL